MGRERMIRHSESDIPMLDPRMRGKTRSMLTTPMPTSGMSVDVNTELLWMSTVRRAPTCERHELIARRSIEVTDDTHEYEEVAREVPERTRQVGVDKLPDERGHAAEEDRVEQLDEHDQTEAEGEERGDDEHEPDGPLGQARLPEHKHTRLGLELALARLPDDRARLVAAARHAVDHRVVQLDDEACEWFGEPVEQLHLGPAAAALRAVLVQGAHQDRRHSLEIGESVLEREQHCHRKHVEDVVNYGAAEGPLELLLILLVSLRH